MMRKIHSNSVQKTTIMQFHYLYNLIIDYLYVSKLRDYSFIKEQCV